MYNNNDDTRLLRNLLVDPSKNSKNRYREVPIVLTPIARSEAAKKKSTNKEAKNGDQLLLTTKKQNGKQREDIRSRSLRARSVSKQSNG